MSDLDEILTQDEAPQAEETAPVEETAATDVAPAETETDETTAAPSAAVENDPASGFRTAMLAEREKRQEVERELAQLRADAETAARPNASEDPEGALAYTEEQVTNRMSQVLRQTSRMIAMSVHPDYVEKENQFLALGEANPALIDAMLNSDNPAEYAYQTAVNHADVEALKDVAGAKAKMRAEVEAQVRAEIAKEGETTKAQQAAIAAAAGIPSLATATAATAGTAMPTDESLDEIIGQ